MNRKRNIVCRTLLLFALCRAVPGYAEEGESSTHGNESKNEIAAFVGVTHAGHRDNAAALGLEYERRINETLGIGALAEFTAGDADF